MVLKSMGAEEKVCVLFPYCLSRGKPVKFQVVDFPRYVHTSTFQVYMHYAPCTVLPICVSDISVNILRCSDNRPSHTRCTENCISTDLCPALTVTVLPPVVALSLSLSVLLVVTRLLGVAGRVVARRCCGRTSHRRPLSWLLLLLIGSSRITFQIHISYFSGNR